MTARIKTEDELLAEGWVWHDSPTVGRVLQAPDNSLCLGPAFWGSTFPRHLATARKYCPSAIHEEYSYRYSDCELGPVTVVPIAGNPNAVVITPDHKGTASFVMTWREVHQHITEGRMARIYDNQPTVSCQHDWVNVGFTTLRLACRHCDKDKPV